MSHHFDLAVIGTPTAASIAAFLCTRRGLRVLVIPGPAAEPSPLLLPSLLLDQLLKRLGRQSGEAQMPRFQVITENCRIDINGPWPLIEELQRELPASHQAVLGFLNKLQAHGLKLERHLLQRPDQPLYGWRARLAGLGRSGARFGTLLQQRIQDPEAQSVLETLFSALSLSPVMDLGVAEAALLWSSLQHPCAISSAEFDRLLTQALNQSDAQLSAAVNHAGLRMSGQGPYTLDMPKGPSMSADVVIIGDPQLLASSPWTSQPSQIAALTTGQLSLQLPEPSISPMLAPRVALADATPLQVLLHRSAPNISLRATWVERDNLPVDWPQKALRRLLPFVDDEAIQSPVTTLTRTVQFNRLFPRPSSAAQSGKDCLLCHAALLYPRLGFFGELLCGFAAAHHLERRFGKKLKAN